MNEDKITLVCPHCGKSTRVKKEGKPNRNIKCSNSECSFIGSMMMYTQKKTSKVNPSSNQQQTVVMDSPQIMGTMIMNHPNTPIMTGVGVLRVLQTGETFTLKTGINIVGRKHPTGHADIAIPCDDGYMSRHHIKIEGCVTSKGIEYRLSDNNSTNKVKLNGYILPPGDIVILKSSDRIIIGRTELEFILQAENSTAGQTLIF